MGLSFKWEGNTYNFDDYDRAKSDSKFSPKPPPKLKRDEYAALSVQDRNRYEALRRLHATYLTQMKQQEEQARRMPPGYDVDVMRRTKVYNESGKALDTGDYKILREGLGSMHKTTEELAKKIEDWLKANKGQKNAKEYSLLHQMVKDNLSLSRKLASGRSVSSRQLSLMLTGYKDIERLATGLDKHLIGTIQMNEFFKRNQIEAAFSMHERNAYTKFLSEVAGKIDLDPRKMPGLDPSKLATSTGGATGVLTTALLGALGPVGQIAGLFINSTAGHAWIEKQGAKAINKMRGAMHARKTARALTEGGLLDAGSEGTTGGGSQVPHFPNAGSDIQVPDTISPESLANTIDQLFEKFKAEYRGDREAMLDDFTDGVIEGIGQELRELSREDVLLLNGRDLSKDLVAELKKSGFDSDTADKMGGAIAMIVKDHIDQMGVLDGAEGEVETSVDKRDREERMFKEDAARQERLSDESTGIIAGKLDEVIDILEEISKRVKRGGGLFGPGGAGSNLVKGIVGGGLGAALLAKGKGIVRGGRTLLSKIPGLARLAPKAVEGAQAANAAVKGGGFLSRVLGAATKMKSPRAAALAAAAAAIGYGATQMGSAEEVDTPTGTTGTDPSTTPSAIEALTGGAEGQATNAVRGTQVGLGVGGWLASKLGAKGLGGAAGKLAKGLGGKIVAPIVLGYDTYKGAKDSYSTSDDGMMRTLKTMEAFGAAGIEFFTFGVADGKKTMKYMEDKLDAGSAGQRLMDMVFGNPEDNARKRQAAELGDKIKKNGWTSLTRSQQLVARELGVPGVGAINHVKAVSSKASTGDFANVVGMTPNAAAKPAFKAKGETQVAGTDVDANYSPDAQQNLINKLTAGEAGDYDTVYGGARRYGTPEQMFGKPLTQLTMGQVREWQRHNLRAQKAAGIPQTKRSSAAGKGQFIYTTLFGEDGKGGLAKKMGLSDDTVFDQATQNKLMMAKLEERGLSKFLNGTMTEDQFKDQLAMEWASIKNSKGHGHYAGQHGSVDPNGILAAAKAMAVENPAPVASLAQVGKAKADFGSVASGVTGDARVTPGKGEALPADQRYAGPAPIPSQQTIVQVPAVAQTNTGGESDSSRNAGLSFSPSLNDSTFSLDDPGIALVASGTV